MKMVERLQAETGDPSSDDTERGHRRDATLGERLLKLALWGVIAATSGQAVASSQDQLCHRTLRSVAVDTTQSDISKAQGSYFNHIYQYSNEPPYYKYVGAGFVGIPYKAVHRDGTRFIRGREDAEGGHHAALRFSGKATLDGITFNVNMDEGSFAFLLFPAQIPSWESNRKGKSYPLSGKDHFLSFQDIPKTRVLTTMGGHVVEVDDRSIHGNSNAFFEYTPRRPVAVRTNPVPVDKFFGRDTLYYAPAQTTYDRPDEEDLWLRTISAEGRRTVEIAGKERSQSVLCRYAYGPIAMTNDQRLRPSIEKELEAWSNQYHRIFEGEQVTHFAKVPRKIAGDVTVNGDCGSTKLQFPKDVSKVSVRTCNYDEQLCYNCVCFYLRVNGEVVLNGRSLGEIAQATVQRETYSFQPLRPHSYARSSRVAEKLRQQDYDGTEWSNDLSDRVWVACNWTPDGQKPDRDFCYLRAKKWVLRSHGCRI